MQKARVDAPTFSTSNVSIHQPAGVLTALMLALMGNMGGLMGTLKCGNVLPTSFWQWLDVRNIATEAPSCSGLAPNTFYGWWWDWSRVVKDTTPAGNLQEVITEAPIFSFVLGDNHPHVMALPFVLIALGLALAAFENAGLKVSVEHKTQDDGRQTSNVSELPYLVLSAIVLGGLSFMNTWDFPVYGTIFVGASLLGCWLRREPLLPALMYGAAVIALGYLIYIPFYATFSSQARGIAVNIFNSTRLPQFFMMFAPFLVAGLGFVLVLARETKHPAMRIAARTLGLAVGLVVLVLVGTVLLGVLSSESRVLAQELQNTGQVLGVTRDQVSSRLLERATSPWLILSLGAGIALCIVLVFSSKRSHARGQAETNTLTSSPPLPLTLSFSAADIFALILFAAGALLTLAVEFVFLRDLFGTRMNTVFKFYYIAWALWSVAGAMPSCASSARPACLQR